MAIALTVVNTDLTAENSWANEGKVHGEGNLAVYATTGIAVAYTDINAALATFDAANNRISGRLTSLTQFRVWTSDVDGHKFGWDKSAGKVKAFSAGSTEVVDTTDITSKLFQWEAIGAF